MAITDENTVLILGAGVSAPFGLPVGSRLIDDIAKNLKRQLSDFEGSTFAGRFSVEPLFPVYDYKIYRKFPYLQPLLWASKEENTSLEASKTSSGFIEKLRWHYTMMLDLSDLLENQTSDSIDDFIIMNKSYADHVKICIAAEFIKALYPDGYLVGIDKRYLDYLDDKGKEIVDQETGEKKKEPERNWIHRLINLIRLGVKEGKVTPENKVKIITFNYDSILEYVLEQQFLNTEHFEELKEKHPDQEISYEDYVDIIHVHGRCGVLEKQMSGNPSETCWEWAQGIHVIREKIRDHPYEIGEERDRAKDWIKAATKIYAAGFAFAKANTDLVGLKEGPPKNIDGRRVINYCNFSGDIGLRNAADKFKYRYKNRQGVESDHAYTKVFEQKEIGVSDWIGVGTLGELP